MVKSRKKGTRIKGGEKREGLRMGKGGRERVKDGRRGNG